MKRPFTLLEVVVAIGVLALSLAGLFTLSAAAQRRMIQAEQDWRETHLFMQAAEFYLLESDTTGTPPPEIFPTGSGYSVRVDYPDAENLPESLLSSNLVTLKSCKIELVRDKDPKVVLSVIVDRFPTEESQ